MRKLLLALGLVLILLLVMALGRCRPGLLAPPLAPQAESMVEPQTATRPLDQLIVAAVSTDAVSATSAYRELERIGHCPYLEDSPESPVGLLTAAYGDQATDAARVSDAIRLLVQWGCDIDQYNASGLTPLHNAVLFRQPELVHFLLEQGADPLLRVIEIPGQALGHSIANLDAYGMALTFQARTPGDAVLGKIVAQLKVPAIHSPEAAR